MKTFIAALAAVATIIIGSTAQAFCGFYVARADTSLFNEASQVVLVRDGNRTVITMANDFEGDVEDFAMVIPVPTFIEREQINVADRALIEHLDAYTAPRLVEYFDPDPCVLYEMDRMAMKSALPATADAEELRRERANSLGVTVPESRSRRRTPRKPTRTFRRASRFARPGRSDHSSIARAGRRPM